MNDPWVRLQLATNASLDWIWHIFAKEGRETAVLAPLAKSPKAAGWLVGCMSTADDDITRKIGAMLVGLIHDDEQTQLLKELLDGERSRFATDPLGANSVTEDILFAAARWTAYGGDSASVGRDILGEIVNDFLESVPWNTAPWAAATLHANTGGDHSVLTKLREAKSSLVPEMAQIAEAILTDDSELLERFVVTPNPIIPFPEDIPDAHLAKELWEAMREAEVEAIKP